MVEKGIKEKVQHSSGSSSGNPGENLPEYPWEYIPVTYQCLPACSLLMAQVRDPFGWRTSLTAHTLYEQNNLCDYYIKFIYNCIEYISGIDPN